MEPVAEPIGGQKLRTIKGIPELGVADLPVLVTEDYVISRWRPSEEDRKRIAEGGDVYLWIMTHVTVPPVYVGTEPPVIKEVPRPVLRASLPLEKRQQKGEERPSNASERG